MAELNKPLEIYKLLNRSNCRKCMLPSCMAFAVAVVQGQKKIGDCPELDARTIETLSGQTSTRKTVEDELQEKLNSLKREVSKVDFASVAEKLGAVASRDKLSVNCLGKDFIIDSSGEMTSECHNNQWVHVPLLSYIAQGQGRALSEDWVAFNELRGAADWSRFFTHRCEEDMKQLVDAHTELFFEILNLFGAQPVAWLDADHSLVVYPLPKLPLVISYWEAEEDFSSNLNIFFDRTASDNLNIESIYVLARGFVEMFRALIVKHNMTGILF